jgi:hypothetical protein
MLLPPFTASIADACDRHPSARAMTAWYRTLDRLVLVMCGHCANTHDVELESQGFELSIDNRAELVQNRLQGAL